MRKVLAVLQGMLQRAVEWERIDSNPVRSVRKPAINRDRVVRALAPVEVEAIRDELRARDATIVSCLAYSGPRPGELLRFPLCWPDLGERTLLYRQPKTKKLPRPVRLVGPLAQDLAEWRLVQARPLSGPVFQAHDGEAWSIDEWRNWVRRIFRPAAERAGVDIGRPYDLRHTWASLLIQEGRLTLVEIAEQMGHSTQTEDCHVFRFGASACRRRDRWAYGRRLRGSERCELRTASLGARLPARRRHCRGPPIRARKAARD